MGLSCTVATDTSSLNSEPERSVFSVSKYPGLVIDGVTQVNIRTDGYGGSPRARVTLLFEIIDAIRNEFPMETGFCLGIKLNSSDYVVSIS